MEGATGTIVRRINTPAGDIIIGGKGKNVYELDKMPGVCAVIDLGGDDEYQEGTVSPERPVLVVIDLAGNDNYVASTPGAQGGAVLGVSMLLDLEGNDIYRARDVAQGSALGGVGILVDYAGNDVYAGYRRVQGQALGGIGILIDREGNDRYHAAMWAQGFGGPLGFGLLDDLAGNDHYSLGGLYPNSFKPETPGYEGWGQGVGAGLRQVANGGIGVLLDGGGDDLYEYDYMAHGGGYWFGVGWPATSAATIVASVELRTSLTEESGRSRSSNDMRADGAVTTPSDSASTTQAMTPTAARSWAWDSPGTCPSECSATSPATTATKPPDKTPKACGAQAGLGILFDYEGNDVYLGAGARLCLTQHFLSLLSPLAAAISAFVVDYGGKDEYGCGVENNSYNQRGSAGGFLIDRPSRKEEREQQAASPPTAKKNDG